MMMLMKGDERMIILMLRKMRYFEDDEVQGEEENKIKNYI